MIEAVIIALIYIAVAAGVVWLIIYVFDSVVGKPIPAKIQQIILIWIVFLLLALLWLLRAILPGIGVALP
jgi:hypothetical protein